MKEKITYIHKKCVVWRQYTAFEKGVLLHVLLIDQYCLILWLL